MSQQAGGAANRAKINEALLAAGDAGATCLEVADIVALPERNARWYLSQTPGLAYKAATKSHAHTRWYHPSFEAAADAYVEEVDGRGRSKSRAGKALIEQTIAAAIDGRTLPEIAEAVGRTVRCIREFLTSIARAGRVQAVRWSGGKGGVYMRYWGVDQVPQQQAQKPPRVRVRAAKPKNARKPKPKQHQKLTLKPKKLPSLVKAQLSGPIIIPAHVKVQVCPHQSDNRFSPTQVQPYFSAMTPGSYMQTGSAIERAYGGGQ